jgi:hypothetical protein
VAFRRHLAMGLAFAEFATIFLVNEIISCDLKKGN